jgi:hypothetical protein
LICLANRAAKSHVVSVRVQNNKIPHPVLLIGWFHFHDGAVLLYFLKILIDLIAEDKGRTPSDWPLMDSMSAEMDTGIPVADSGLGTELKVLFEREHVLTILERVNKAAHLKDRTNPLRFHFVAKRRTRNLIGVSTAEHLIGRGPAFFA